MNTKTDRAAWIQGGHANCNIQPLIQRRPARIVLLGAPGVGKGTQAQLLSERLGACHLSTGDIFRAAKRVDGCAASPTMTRALRHMQAGELVPDDVVLSLVSERARCLNCGGGFLLDGFPRTFFQALMLDEFLRTHRVSLDAVINYELPIPTIVQRLSGRRTCVGCKAVYHTTSLPSKKEGVCDHCGGELRQRDDDRREAVEVRMAAYESSTALVTGYYRDRGLLVSVYADGTPEEILERTLAELAEQKAARANVQAG